MMVNKTIHIGQNKLHVNTEHVQGKYVEIDGEMFYRISNYNKMTPFFMSIVSCSDHWMFISSNGGLTAGRKNPDNALFPYYTDDLIHDSNEKTGSKTIFKIELEDGTFLWEPFSDNYQNVYKTERNIYKNTPGNKIVFEEKNHDLGLTFSYSWLNSERFGFVKKSKITNNNNAEITVELLDGIQNILPYGVYQKFQTEFSTLVDGYKKNELINEYGIGIYSLSSIPSDKAEPSESLKATTVWSAGIKVENYLLSSRQIIAFRSGFEIENESDIKGTRGSYFIKSQLKLKSNESQKWVIVSDINRDSSDLVALIEFFKSEENIVQSVLKDVEIGTEGLVKIVASSDGLQLTADTLATSRHFSNVLFNVMRGGIFADSYIIERDDFISFVQVANKKVFDRYEKFVKELSPSLQYNELQANIKKLGDNEFNKLSLEYLPLTFSRRHGDPSRPWNRFSIDIKDEENNKLLNYQGNWRDIFQNWEALAESFPNYIEAMITKFLNGSTADGYNPYRVTRDGFDWEAPEADSPWTNIGYWGDHQIIYLLKLLEFSSKHASTKLDEMINEDVFTYLNVPYKIKSYQELLADPRNTIDFNSNLHKKIEEHEGEIGSDARYILNSDESLYQVNLTEKLLATLLSKLSNFIPGGGIWMNTQRPEWNDANNALVGNGVSMVTLYYTRRYVNYLIKFFSRSGITETKISEKLKVFFDEINQVLEANEGILETKISDEDRKTVLDGLGIAGSKFRLSIYDEKFISSKENISIKDIIRLLKLTKKYLENTIDSNKREDGLFHAYNLMSVKNKNAIEITYLYEMLEGQVAVLSSEYLTTNQSIELLTTLRNSSLYREDQNSYILYPNRELSLFINKNNVNEEDYNSSTVMQKLVEIGNKDIILKDVSGGIHFNSDIRNAQYLKSKLSELCEKGIITIDDEEKSKILSAYESVFIHKSFTGRSGAFYKYEGLGSIYWHMVSKLVLAIQDTYYKAKKENADTHELEKLKSQYYDAKDGIGVYKSPKNYGAFPTDPYSHTPSFSGVQQPGMTGQVKEDVISRFGELGVLIENGKIRFDTSLINMDEFLKVESTFNYYDVHGTKKELLIEESSLAFTYCQVPIVYSLSDESEIDVYTNEEKTEIKKMELNSDLSNSIFNRDGKIEKIEVKIEKNRN